MNQKKLIEKITLASSMIQESSSRGYGDYIIASEWVIGTILEIKSTERKAKIKKILSKI